MMYEHLGAGNRMVVSDQRRQLELRLPLEYHGGPSGRVYKGPGRGLHTAGVWPWAAQPPRASASGLAGPQGAATSTKGSDSALPLVPSFYAELLCRKISTPGIFLGRQVAKK